MELKIQMDNGIPKISIDGKKIAELIDPKSLDFLMADAKEKIEEEKELFLAEYQTQAARTLNTENGWKNTIHNMIYGINGEVGELTDHLKKIFFHGHKEDIDHIEEEIGDILWYVAGLATIYNLDLNEVAKKNIQKLTLRYPEGFSKEKSINREI